MEKVADFTGHNGIQIVGNLFIVKVMALAEIDFFFQIICALLGIEYKPEARVGLNH
jgi:hypothetical protein